MTTVITGFSPAGYLLYGRRFLETFDKYWPPNISLLCYVEAPVKFKSEHGRHIEFIELLSCSGVKEFITRNSNDKLRNGHHKGSYNFRFDAVKFCRQAYIPYHAYHHVSDDILVWLDGDVISFAKVPDDFVGRMLGSADVCYLGRKEKHSELGFWAMRRSIRVGHLLYMFMDLYNSDSVFSLAEWHSAYVFDHCRRTYGTLVGKDLTPGGKGHVWFQCELSYYTDHLKGNQRKKAGTSAERKVRISHG